MNCGQKPDKVNGMKHSTAQLIAASGIALFLLAMVFGPLLSPPAFSLLRHTTSEQAAQHLAGAWAMRAGFVAFGLATLAAAITDWSTRPFVRAALVVFGLGMIAAAIWSNAPILPELPVDLREDQRHSIASSVVGAAFAAACAARLFAPGGSKKAPLAWAGLVISVAVPLAMLAFPEVKGLLQRGMFAFSFVFILYEFA